MPSYKEPFGAVTNEALQGGCKVLISRLAGSACLVSDTINGYIISIINKIPTNEEVIILNIENYELKVIEVDEGKKIPYETSVPKNS